MKVVLPTVEAFETVKVGHRVSYHAGDAYGGNKRMKKRQYGVVRSIKDSTAQVGDVLIPLRKVRRVGSDVYREFQRAKQKSERQQVYGKLRPKAKKRLAACAKQARVAAGYLCSGGWTGPADARYLAAVKTCREARMKRWGIHDTTDRGQCKALPWFMQEAMAGGAVPEVRGIEYLSAETGPLEVGQRIRLGGKLFTFTGFDGDKAVLRSGSKTLKVPFERVPHDVGSGTLPATRRKVRHGVAVAVRRKPRHATKHVLHRRYSRGCFKLCLRRARSGRFKAMRNPGGFRVEPERDAMLGDVSQSIYDHGYNYVGKVTGKPGQWFAMNAEGKAIGMYRERVDAIRRVERSVPRKRNPQLGLDFERDDKDFMEWKKGVQFAHYKGQRKLFVLAGPSAYWFAQQRNGKLTMQPDAVLRDVFEKQVAPWLHAPSFVETLQKHQAGIANMEAERSGVLKNAETEAVAQRIADLMRAGDKEGANREYGDFIEQRKLVNWEQIALKDRALILAKQLQHNPWRRNPGGMGRVSSESQSFYRGVSLGNLAVNAIQSYAAWKRSAHKPRHLLEALQELNRRGYTTSRMSVPVGTPKEREAVALKSLRRITHGYDAGTQGTLFKMNPQLGLDFESWQRGVSLPSAVQHYYKMHNLSEPVDFKQVGGWTVVLDRGVKTKHTDRSDVWGVTAHPASGVVVVDGFRGANAQVQAAARYGKWNTDTTPVYIRIGSHRGRESVERAVGHPVRSYYTMSGGHWYEIAANEFEKVRGIPGVTKSKLPSDALRTWSDKRNPPCDEMPRQKALMWRVEASHA